MTDAQFDQLLARLDRHNEVLSTCAAALLFWATGNMVGLAEIMDGDLDIEPGDLN